MRCKGHSLSGSRGREHSVFSTLSKWIYGRPSGDFNKPIGGGGSDGGGPSGEFSDSIGDGGLDGGESSDVSLRLDYRRQIGRRQTQRQGQRPPAIGGGGSDSGGSSGDVSDLICGGGDSIGSEWPGRRRAQPPSILGTMKRPGGPGWITESPLL